MSQHCDILIIGGGVIGLTTAWYLANEGARVAVVDREEMGRQASWAGAGIIPPADLTHARTPIELLRAHSCRLYPQLSAELLELTGTDNGFMLCGGIELPDPGHPDQALPTEEWHSPGTVFERLTQPSLSQCDPWLAPDFQEGVFLPGLAQVRNPRHVQALMAGCVRRGVTLLPLWPVSRLVTQGSRVVSVEGERGRLLTGEVLVASGAWADQLLQQVGCRPGVVPVRGQIALLDTGRPGIWPILMQGKRYLVTRRDGKLLAGSTEEYASFDARPTLDGIEGLLAFARRLMPELTSKPLLGCWAGLRPGSPDGLPFMGRVPGFDNLHLSCGHFRAGLQLSPGSGKVMAEHLLGHPVSVPLEAFAPGRPV